MTQKEKKEYILLVVLVIGIIFVYMMFIRRPAPAPEDTSVVPGADITGTVPGAPVVHTQGFLPYGTTLDNGVAKDPRFKALVPPTYPQVDMSMVGVSNPFAE